MPTSATRLTRLFGPTKRVEAGRQALTLRFATPADAAELARLAQLDSARVPTGTVLVAQVGIELWAAVSLDDGTDVADPFRPAGELVALLHERARQIRRSHGYRARSEARMPAARWPRRLHHS